jgi:hypothetical protein
MADGSLMPGINSAVIAKSSQGGADSVVLQDMDQFHDTMAERLRHTEFDHSSTDQHVQTDPGRVFTRCCISAREIGVPFVLDSRRPIGSHCRSLRLALFFVDLWLKIVLGRRALADQLSAHRAALRRP